jgi:hypothetical protein
MTVSLGLMLLISSRGIGMDPKHNKNIKDAPTGLDHKTVAWFSGPLCERYMALPD